MVVDPSLACILVLQDLGPPGDRRHQDAVLHRPLHQLIHRLRPDKATDHVGDRVIVGLGYGKLLRSVPVLCREDGIGGAIRSEERRVGKECVSKCRSLWETLNKKQKTSNKTEHIKRIKK